jgi:hypothetical protein
MPRGLANNKDRDPRNFTLAEWQQAKRVGRHAGDLKADIQEAWAISDSRNSFSHALEERGLFLARGDRRGHVAVTYEGEAISIPRAIGKKSKDVTMRLGKPQELNNVSETRQRIAKDIVPKLASHITKARADATAEKSALEIRRQGMQAQQQAERAKLDAGQKARVEQEAAERSARFRKGLRGLLDRVTGKRAALEKQNEMEAIWSLQRDREQRHALVEAQLRDRQSLQAEILAARNRHAEVLRGLHHDRTNNRLMMRGLEPSTLKAEKTKVAVQSVKQAFDYTQEKMSAARVKIAQERLEALRKDQQEKPTVRVRQTGKDAVSPQDRLQRLRDGQIRKPRGPELDR